MIDIIIIYLKIVESDSVPRRKPKTKSNSSPSAVAATSATITLPIDNHAVVQKHLDEWLDGCLKDAPLTSSSSEFLDNNFPSLNHNGSTSSQPRGGPTMINHNSNSNTNTTNPNHLPSYSNNPTTASAAQAAAFYLNSSGGGGAGVFTAPPKPSDTPTRSGGGGGGGLHDPFNGGYQRVSRKPFACQSVVSTLAIVYRRLTHYGHLNCEAKVTCCLLS